MSDATPLTRHTGHLVEGMVWTSKKPTVPGWYWYRHLSRVSTALIRDWPGCDVANMQANLTHDNGTISFGTMTNLCSGGLWSGPIPLPSEAPAQGWYKAEEVDQRDKELTVDIEALGGNGAHRKALMEQCFSDDAWWAANPILGGFTEWVRQRLLDRLKGGV